MSVDAWSPSGGASRTFRCQRDAGSTLHKIDFQAHALQYVPRMNLLPFDNLPSYAPRRFVPQDFDLGDWKQIEPLFDELEARAAQSQTLPDFEQWILDGGELSAALDEEGSKRYIAMTCHTDNAEA